MPGRLVNIGMEAGRFPLRLGRQARAGPAGERICFVPIDVTHRASGSSWLPVRPSPSATSAPSRSCQYNGADQPCACTCAQPSDIHSVARAITAIAHEVEPFADCAPAAMPARNPAAARRCAGVSLSKQNPSPCQPIRTTPPLKPTKLRGRLGARRLLPIRQHGGRQWVLRERVQHVGQQKFLMLLLVLQAKFDQRRGIVADVRHQPRHRSIDMRTIRAPRARFDGRVSRPRIGRG